MTASQLGTDMWEIAVVVELKLQRGRLGSICIDGSVGSVIGRMRKKNRMINLSQNTLKIKTRIRTLWENIAVSEK